MPLFSFLKPRPVIRLDPHPNPKAIAQITAYCLRLHWHLLPRIGLFDAFDVRFAAYGTLGHNILGRYIAGSCRNPVMYLDLQTCGDVAKRKCIKRSFVYFSTVIHELGHACQEACGLPFDESEAEEFAMRYCEDGTVWQFWTE